MQNKGESEKAPLGYVLITPARREATFIEQPFLSVIGQTIKPTKWVIELPPIS